MLAGPATAAAVNAERAAMFDHCIKGSFDANRVASHNMQFSSLAQFLAAAWHNPATNPNDLSVLAVGLVLTCKRTLHCKVLHRTAANHLELYAESTPSARQVIDRVYNQGYGQDQIFHDHFAFRTFGVRDWLTQHLLPRKWLPSWVRLLCLARECVIDWLMD
jgi:hypothetical protein